MTANFNVVRLKAGDIAYARAALDLFGRAFGEADTYSGNQPDDGWLGDLLSGDDFVFLIARAKGWARLVLLILTVIGFAQVCMAAGMAWRRAPEMWEFLLGFPYLFGTVLPLVLNFVALHLLYFSSGKWFRRSVAGR